MPLTRANLEAYLVGTLGGKLAFVGKSIATNGTNPDLALPIASAAAALGGSIADFAAITDLELAAIRNAPALQGLARLFVLEEIWGCMTDVTTSGLDLSQAWSDLSKEIQDDIARLEARYKTVLQVYGKVVGGRTTIHAGRRGWGAEV